MIGAIYMALGSDTGGSGVISLWTPSTYDHWNAIFWGVFVYAAVLPTAYLAWAAPAPFSDVEDAELASGD